VHHGRGAGPRRKSGRDPQKEMSFLSSLSTNAPLHRRDFAPLANALIALDRTMDASSKADLAALAYGRTLPELAQNLLEAIDPAAIRAAAQLLAANEGGCTCSGDAPPEPTFTQVDDVSGRFTRSASAPFDNNPALCERILSLLKKRSG